MTSHDLAAFIERHVRPSTFPVACAFLREGDSLPEKVRRPKADMGFESAVCQAITIARRYGWTVALSSEDISCPITKAAFGFETAVPYFTEGHACAGMYTADAAAGGKTEKAIPRSPYGEVTYLLFGPLARADWKWDVCIVYGNSAQIMRMVIAALHESGGVMKSQTAGRVDCADIILGPLQSGECAYVLPCYGDRIFGGAADDEMAFSLPVGKTDTFVCGMEGSHQGGIRYPIPTYLKYTAAFPPSYQKLDEIWREMKTSNSPGRQAPPEDQ